MNPHNQHLTRRKFLETVALVGLGPAVTPLFLPAGETASSQRSRIAYYCNGEIQVNFPGQPEGKPITTGHWDFKRSWSKTGDMLVCFRRLKNDPITANWRTAIFIVNVDGSGLYFLSDGTHTDFNPTWTRDGSTQRISTNPKADYRYPNGEAAPC